MAARQPNTQLHRGAEVLSSGVGSGGEAPLSFFRERACYLALVLNLSFSAVYSRQVYQSVDHVGPAHTTPLPGQLHPQGSPRVKSLTSTSSVFPLYFPECQQHQLRVQQTGLGLWLDVLGHHTSPL